MSCYVSQAQIKLLPFDLCNLNNSIWKVDINSVIDLSDPVNSFLSKASIAWCAKFVRWFQLWISARIDKKNEYRIRIQSISNIRNKTGAKETIKNVPKRPASTWPALFNPDGSTSWNSCSWGFTVKDVSVVFVGKDKCWPGLLILRLNKRHVLRKPT